MDKRKKGKRQNLKWPVKSRGKNYSPGSACTQTLLLWNNAEQLNDFAQNPWMAGGREWALEVNLEKGAQDHVQTTCLIFPKMETP